MSITLQSPAPQSDFGRGPHWLHESPFLPLLWEQTQELGAPSLKHAAMKRALMDQSALKLELFEQVPWRIAQYLWECLGRCNKQTLHMWKIMARAYPQHFRQLSSLYCLEVERPKEPLKVYIDLMICGPCNWRAVLGLSSSYATITDLVAIGNMKNLVALEIYTSPSRDMKPQDYDEGRGLGLDDRIVRSWVEVAESSGSLQQLRVLRLCKQANLTTHALWMLEKLPHLQLLVAYHCGSLNEGLKESIKGKKDGVRFGGWIACRLDSILGDQEAETMGFRHLCPLLDVYKDILSTASDGHGHVAPDRGPKSCAGLGSEQEPSNMGSDVPIMEFQLSRGFIISGSDPEMVLNRAKYEAAQFVFLTRVPSREKKRAPSQSIPRSKGKRVMKDRVGRDMADVLGDFL